MIWRDKVVNEAMEWLGTPYHTMAKLKGIGVDCAQLLIAVYSNCGLIEDFDTGTYSHEWHMHRSEELYLKNILEYAYKVPFKERQKGDVFLYKYGRCISHGGIYIGNNEIIHAYAGKGVILSLYNDPILLHNNGKSRLVGVYRLKGA